MDTVPFKKYPGLESVRNQDTVKSPPLNTILKFINKPSNSNILRNLHSQTLESNRGLKVSIFNIN